LFKDPVFSFVIPVYKKNPETFAECLKSLFDMSFKEIEVIAVFDGADAELEAVAKRFPKVISKVIEHGGACKARNVGTELSRGRYVACWDADCFAKPEMAKRWLEEFEAVPDADFVYTGYEVSGERGGHDSEAFDPYSLTCGNYISSMAPIKREKAPKWDETLAGAQDWDFWLTAVENGCKGAWIEGAGFITERSGPGISSSAWAPENREKTIRTVREKHGIHRDAGVYSPNYPARGLKLAQILGADFIKETGQAPSEYRAIFNLGYSFLSRFEGIGSDVPKIQYWLPGEIAGLAEARYPTVMETIRIAKGVINLCNTNFEANKLSELGISADVVPLALMEQDIEKVQKALPEKFSVLVLCDEAYAELFKEITFDLPHITFGFNAGKVRDFSCVMSFYKFAALDEGMLVALVNGRNVISNVQEPYCGFIDPEQTWDAFKLQLYEAIRQARTKPFNQAAQDLYLRIADPAAFREKIRSYTAAKLEVLS
jgi:glycosyltransferase involved in cell wall biosynthesis